jgi:hypothetical protein
MLWSVAVNKLSSFDNSHVRRPPPFGRTDSASELFAMIQELSRTARRLQEREPELRPPANHELEADARLAVKVRRLLIDRERRKNIFPAELFADPAWDILLNLYASHLEQHRETITGLISLAGVPTTTGLRWLHKLVDENLLILSNDPLDQRRKWVMLSPSCLASLRTYFDPAPVHAQAA